MLRSKSSIKKKFNKIFSYVYFLVESLTYSIRLKIINEIPNLKHKKILDICCGTGINSLILAEQGANVIGIDLSKNQIELANKRKEEHQNLILKYQVMDAESLDFSDDSFDFFYLLLVFMKLGL